MALSLRATLLSKFGVSESSQIRSKFQVREVHRLGLGTSELSKGERHLVSRRHDEHEWYLDMLTVLFFYDGCRNRCT